MSDTTQPDQEQSLDDSRPKNWLHGCSLVLICLTWPLIWIGGLVTTYDAGMAVPDWPQTYGYNMFLYPLSTWFFGPFDLFIEHGHRLLASLVGLITIVLVVLAKRREDRVWVVRLCYITLAGVILQGMLGGIRVVLDARLVAMVHGCVGPAFFALCWIVACVTSRWWNAPETPNLQGKSARLPLFCLSLSLLSYLQLAIGAQLRHFPADSSRFFFQHTALTHVAVAGLLAILVIVFAGCAWRCGDLTLSRVGLVLVGLVLIQWSLGVGTWLVNYGLPFHRWPIATHYVIIAKGWYESLIVTGHVATGSLILAVSVFATVRSGRVWNVGWFKGHSLQG